MRSTSFLGLGFLVGCLAAVGCASTVAVPTVPQAIKLIVDRDAELQVVCDGKVAYSLFVQKGEDNFLPFEEARCELRSKEPVRLRADVKFR